MPVLRTQSKTIPVSEQLVGRGWAEWIAWQLEDAGFRILLQAWDFVPGSNWISTMHAGVQDAKSGTCSDRHGSAQRGPLLTPKGGTER
ncbi:MAG: toll/interleukin-1 receptor domain-containing protein [Pseudonocardiaceae bacterium]